MELSLVVPVFNEEDNLRPLFEETREVLDREYGSWEVIFVDDGSTDSSGEILEDIAGENPGVKVLELRTNFGQTQAIQAGMDHAAGHLIATMDADMQNDPEDIPRLVEKMEASGCDLVTGWRRDREDSIGKRISSRIASRLRRVFLGTELHDYGCGLKLFRKEAAEELSMRGEMHRYVPPILEGKGYRVCESEVNHRERNAGETKYSWRRLPRGFIDMLNVWFWQKYEERPLHVFGGLGIVSIILGGLLFLFALYQKLVLGTSLTDTAATILSAFLILAGIQFFISGIMADISIRSYHDNRDMQNYSVKKIVNGQDRDTAEIEEEIKQT